jgi:hypothetical protein
VPRGGAQRRSACGAVLLLFLSSHCPGGAKGFGGAVIVTVLVLVLIEVPDVVVVVVVVVGSVVVVVVGVSVVTVVVGVVVAVVVIVVVDVLDVVGVVMVVVVRPVFDGPLVSFTIAKMARPRMIAARTPNRKYAHGCWYHGVGGSPGGPGGPPGGCWPYPP